MTSQDDSLSDWVRAHYERGFRTAVLICGNRADAEEALQDAFLRAWRFRDSLPDGPRRDAWLYRVLVNSCYSKLRREIPRRERERDRPDLDAERSVVAESPACAAEQSALADALLGALQDLPEALRVVVVLRYYADLSEREIATAISRRPGTVKSRLHEARRRLAADGHLSGYAHDDEVTSR